jgi:hypothetical protein
MVDVFLSYASEDRGKAEPFVAVLERQKWSVWWDMRIPPGEDYESFIKQRLDAARCVIVLWSRHSTASRWVRAEADSAADRRVLVNALINGVELPLSVRTIQAARLTDWDGSSPHPELDRLLAAVADRLGTQSVQAVAPAPPPPRWKRWLLVAAVSAHVAAALALVFVRVSATEIRLDLQTTDVGFASSTQQPFITDPLRVASLGVSGLAGIDLPQVQSPGIRPYHESSLLVTAMAAPTTGDAGAIYVDPLSLRAGSQVSLRRTDVADEYRLSLQNAPELGASVQGSIRMVIPQQLDEQIDLGHPRRVGLHPDSGVVDLDLSLPDAYPRPFAPRLAVNDLRLYRIDRFDGEPAVVSTVLGGRLFFVTLGEEGRALERGAMIRFERSVGEIEGLQPSGGKVVLRFSGRVNAMSLGSGASTENLMPTWLDWVLAHRSLKILGDVYLVLLAVTAATVRWWRKVAPWLARS